MNSLCDAESDGWWMKWCMDYERWMSVDEWWKDAMMRRWIFLWNKLSKIWKKIEGLVVKVEMMKVDEKLYKEVAF